MGPKAKAKTKAKAKATAGKDHTGLGRPAGVAQGGKPGKPKSGDPELEALDNKRKMVLMGNKWRERLSELDQEITICVEESDKFDECRERLISIACEVE